MVSIFSVYVFWLGLVVGSFLNVVIYRFNTGATLQGRSMCFTCGKTLLWYELVPLFSFLFQRGKCRGCRAKISWQYPLVEFVTGVLFVLASFVAIDMVHFIYLILQMSLLVIIGVYDIRHKIIPDLFSYGFAALALAYLLYTFLTGDFSWGMLLPEFIAGPLYFSPFAAMWYFSKGTWMGFGDAKLSLGIGWFLGLTQTYLAMILAFWAGACVGLGLVLYGKFMSFAKTERNITMKSEIPFGPFLIFGLLVMLFYGEYVEALFLGIF